MPAVSQHQPNARPSDMQTQAPPAKHKRFASLLRLPSSSSASSRKDKDKETPPASSPRSRRATTNPTTPTAPAQNAPSASTSYFSAQPGSSGSGTDLRSPASKRPPASFSGHGKQLSCIDNSRGPPVALITRGNSDYARKKAPPATTPTSISTSTLTPTQTQPQPQPQRQHSALPTPIAGLQRMGHQHQHQRQHQHNNNNNNNNNDDDDDDSDSSSASDTTASIPAASKPMLSRQSTITSVRSSRHVSGSRDESSDLDDTRSGHGHFGRSVRIVSGTDSEDLFMNIASDSSAPRQRALDAAARQDRLRSRIARVNNRHSTPSGAPSSSSPVHAISAYTTPTASRIPLNSSTDPKTSALPRRTTTLPTPTRTSYQSPLSPNNATETHSTRLPELNAKASFSSSRRDAELTPSEFLASMRRPSAPDALQTPPKRAATHAYRPSNLGYTPARKEPKTPQSESRHEASSHHDTESHGSTGPAASVWDELDELKTRIKKIELGGGKTPATSNAAVAQASAERPRTANTTATTVSSSPHQQRKLSGSPSESTVEAPVNKVQPLLRDALAKAKQHTTHSVFRVLETTATEAIALAEMAGSTGMLSSAASVYSGAAAADRQVRRKADNICRSLTELCIALCDTKPSLSGPAIRSSAAAAAARRPSVQVNGESPKTTRDGEDTGSVVSFSAGVSPSRALERIEARRTSMLAASTSKRPTSRDTNGSNDPLAASRMQRASTSLNRTRRQSDADADTDADADEDEDDTLRAPSRAMTDFRQLRSINTNTSTHTNLNNSSFEKNRHSRTYMSQEPMPELQPSPKFQPTPSQRRPTVTGVPNENSLLFRDSPRRFNFDRQSSPAVEKQTVNGLRARLQLGANRNNLNRNSIGTTADLSRSMSLGRTRMRGASTGE